MINVVLVPIAVTAMIAVALLQRPTDRSVGAFAKTYDVSLTTGNVAILRSYIWWTRGWRIGGAALLLTVSNIVAFARDEPTGLEWYAVIAGYAFGALLGELFRPRGERPARSMASLERRRITDYVSRWFFAAAGLLLAATLVGATWLLLNPTTGGWFMYAPGSSDTESLGQARSASWFVAGLTAIAILVVITCWIGARRLAQAPVPAARPDQQAVHHAIRTAAILSVAGGAVLAIGGIGLRFTNEAALNDTGEAGIIQWALNISYFVCIFAPLWGAILTLTAVPRFAPFAGPLPRVPSTEPS